MRKKVFYIACAIILGAIFVFFSLRNAVRSSKTLHETISIQEIKQRPWIINDEGNLKSETELVIRSDHAFEAWCKIAIAGKKPYIQSLGTLHAGVNNVIVNILELDKDNDNVTFMIHDNIKGSGQSLCSKTSSQKKIRHWKIYVAHDMHTDLGWNSYQEDLINEKWPSYLDAANKNIGQTSSWDDNSKFRYPIESSYMLYGSAMRMRDADWIQKMKENLAKGYIAYSSSYLGFGMEGMGAEQMARMNYFSERYLKDIMGTGSSSVFSKTDDPGFSWAGVDALAQSGIKYLMLRFNGREWLSAVKPGAANSSYPGLFYLQGQSSKNKLLVCNGQQYSNEQYEFGLKEPDSEAVYRNITGKLLNMQRSDYPYDALIENFTDHDNHSIIECVKDNIYAINNKKDSAGREYVYPKVISSTVNDFFEYIEKNYAQVIPTFKGTMESWWTYGLAGYAYESGLNKINHNKLPFAEFLATISNIFGWGRGCGWKDKRYNDTF